MSADESALLAAVAADPASDLPRLVYADYLDDHGQHIRAEFIRLQCEIARLEVGPRAVVDANWRLWKRQQDLLDDHWVELVGAANPLREVRPRLRRGFIDDIEVDANKFRDIETALLTATPIPSRVSVLQVARWAHILNKSASAALGLVTEIHAVDPPTHSVTFTDCLDGEYLRRESNFPRVAVLDLAAAQYGADVLGWFDDDGFPSLRDADLSDNDLTDSEVIRLLNMDVPQRVSRLALDGNPVGDQAAFELADRLAAVKTFRTLDFRRTHVTSAGQAALTAAFGSRCNLF